MKPRSLHLIGNAHIDPVWLWRWQEGFHEIKASFRSALERMKEFPTFTFTASSAAFYEWIEEHDPGLFAEIQQRISEGRWGLVGGWWVEPDCNIPCGESFVRQALYGQRYFWQKFGKIARTGYNVDSFGHHGMLPQILAKCGIENYVFMRPGPDEKELPGHLFWWQAPDGSRVLAFRVIDTYATWEGMLEDLILRCADELRVPYFALMCFYGVGDHGGGPTIENIQTVQRLQQSADLPELVFSTPDRFFDYIRNHSLDWPTVSDDLQHHARGCYAAHSGIKQWNRRAENSLLAAEKMASVATAITSLPYPADFARAWKNVLFNQFHDSLAGTCLEIAYEDAQAMAGESLAIAGRALNAAAQALLWQIDTSSEEGIPIVIFNPQVSPALAYVEIELRNLEDDSILIAPSGEPVVYQKVQPQTVVWGRERIGFVARLPALGYAVYRLTNKQEKVPLNPTQSSASHLENRRFRLQFNPETGCLASLYDKQLQREFLAGEAARPVVIDDPSDTWGHNISRFDRVIGVFTPRRLWLAEDGPVQSTLCIESEYNGSRLWQSFTLYQELEQIDVAVAVDWREQYKTLKLRFPLAVQADWATYEIPYGVIQRPMSGEEEPGQSWVDVSGTLAGKACGLSLLNDGKYSLDVMDSDIGLTVLRSPLYAQHDPRKPEPDRQYHFMDQGWQRFRYSLVPHAGDWRQAALPQRAALFNQPPFLYETNSHPGKLPLSTSFLFVDQPNILVTVVKKAEEGHDLIVRACEACGVTTSATLHLAAWQRVAQITFQPYEIKTLLIPEKPEGSIQEINFLEILA